MLNEKFKEIIDFAIEREKEAVQFYNDLQNMVKFEPYKEVLIEFEDMEKSHIRVLHEIQKGEFSAEKLPKIESLAYADYIVEKEPNPDMNFQDIITIAMKREDKAQKLYLELANKSSDESVRNLFLRLANEEAKHKLHFEKIFDDEVLKEN
ncbi:MAG: ferritin family protein [Ignavibacteriales bacterium]|nr:ferritin family protein [Ignavibacteriales bacterium]